VVMHIVWRRWGRAAGLVAGMAFALAPAAVFASRRIYAQDLVPLLSALVLLWMMRYVDQRRPRDLLLGVMMTLWLVQIHFSGLAVAAGLVVAVVWIRPRLSWKALLGGVALGLIPLIPYLVHLLQSQFMDVRMIAATIATGDASAPRQPWMPWWIAFHLPGAADLENIFAHWVREAPLAWRALTWLGNAVVALSVLALFPAAFRPGHDRCRSRLLLSLILTPLALFSLMRLRMIPSYLFILFPPLFVALGREVGLCGTGASAGQFGAEQEEGRPAGAPSPQLSAVPNRVSRGTWIGILATVWAVAQVYFVTMLLGWVDRAEPEYAPYVPYRDQVAACAFIASELQPGQTHLRQNFWSAERGIEYNYLYLIHWLYGTEERALLAKDADSATRHLRLIEWPYLRQHPPTTQQISPFRAPIVNFGALTVSGAE